MSSFLDKLNLRPNERRLVVVVAIVVFVVLNFIFVWSHFGDLGRWQTRKRDAAAKLQQYQGEIQKKNAYQKEKAKLQAQGQTVASEAQSLEFQKEVDRHARQANVTVTRWSPQQRTSKTNAFFEEHSLNVAVSSGEKELVDFLYTLGSSESLIRVRSLSLAPDSSGTRLVGNLTLVESFQKKVPAKTTAATPSATTTNITPAPPASAPIAKPTVATNVSALKKIRSSPAATPVQPVGATAPPAQPVAAPGTVDSSAATTNAAVPPKIRSSPGPVPGQTNLSVPPVKPPQ